MFSEPVVLEQQNVSTVPNYGSGIAPYFLSLAFFVGGDNSIQYSSSWKTKRADCKWNPSFS